MFDTIGDIIKDKIKFIESNSDLKIVIEGEPDRWNKDIIIKKDGKEMTRHNNMFQQQVYYFLSGMEDCLRSIYT